MLKKIDCERCQGSGHDGYYGNSSEPRYIDCEKCNGIGYSLIEDNTPQPAPYYPSKSTPPSSIKSVPSKVIGSSQIIHFKGGIKRTIENIKYIYENEMTHVITEKGTEWIINKNNVLCVECVPPKEKL